MFEGISVTSGRPSESIKFSGVGISKSDIEFFMRFPGDATLMIEASDLTMPSSDIPSVLLRLLKYDDQFAIDFNFDESDVAGLSAVTLMKHLRAYTSKLGKNMKMVLGLGP